MNEAKLILGELKNSVVSISDTETVKKTANRALETGVNPTEIVNVLSEALNEIGDKYERCEYFLSELMMGGVIANEVTNMLKPHLTGIERERLGKVAIGTVKGDLHDIGKNIVIMMLSAVGLEVFDLGVDVSAEKFAEIVQRERISILGMSALLSSTMNEMKNVIDTLKEKKLRNSTKVIVGGRPITKEFAEKIGADGYAKDATEAVKIVKQLLNVRRGFP